MMAVFFYLFAVLCVASAALVVAARNPVHAVLFLILAFFNAAGLFVLLSAEFLAMLLIIVYVGAVAVLFLFVVMILDVDFAELRAGFVRNAPVGLLVGGIVLAELLLLFVSRGAGLGFVRPPGAPVPEGVSNTAALGRILYTKYFFLFQGAGLILFTAMIGAVVLTLRHRAGVRSQSVAAQVARSPATGVALIKVTPGTAVIPPAE